MSYRIRIPHTNPFPMFKTVNGARVYTPFDDKLKAVHGRVFNQPWALTDRLSFQMSWQGVPLNSSLVTYVRFYVNGDLRKTVTFHFGTADVQGTAYTCFAKQKAVKGTSSYNGLFCFSQVVGSIKDSNNATMLTAGDCLQIRIADPTGTVWESNPMDIIASTEGTKLIHYANTSETDELVFDTYFGYMPYGYDLRLPGYYSGFGMNTDMDLFDTSSGGKLMVQSTPRWITTLHLGQDGVGIPLYHIMLMNMVMSCDTKSLADFGDFEFNDGGFDMETNPDYSNDFYTATIVAKDNILSQQSESVAGKFVIFAEVKYKGNFAYIVVNVVSSNNGQWHLVPSVMTGATSATRLTGGDGKTTLVLDYGVIRTDTEVTIAALDALDVVLGSVTVNLKAMLKGLNYMEIGQTFIVK